MRVSRLSRRTAAAALVLIACTEPTTVQGPEARPAPVRAGRAAASMLPHDVRTIFGPAVFERAKGAPVTETVVLTGFGPSATIRISNGDGNDKRRVSSAQIAINGLEVVGPSAFPDRGGELAVPVSLPNPAILTVRLASAPGSFLTISIDGTLATEATVPTTGGTAELLGGQVVLEVPAGALSTPVTLTAEPVAAPDAAPLPGTALELGPTGTTFAEPIDLTIAFDAAALPRWVDPSRLRMNWWNVDHWEELPGNAVDVAHSKVTAQTTHFSTFALLPDAREFCPGDPTADSDLQTAVNAVPANGTVYVCDGTFTIDEVHLNKPLTLRSEHHGLTTLRDADPGPAFQGGRPALWVDHPAGTVRIVDLKFDVGGRAIVAQGHDVVEIDSIDAVGRDSTIAIPVAVIGGTTVPSTGRVEVTRSRFDHMSIGVFPTRDALVNVRLSLFERFNFGSVTHSNASVAGVTYASAGVVEDNVMRACGTTTCLRTFARSTAIRRNRFELPDGLSRTAAISIQRGTGVANAQPIIVEDNEIIAASRVVSPVVAGDYTAQAGILVSNTSTAAGPDTIRRNRVVGAFAGIQVTTPMVAMDNRIENGPRAFTHTAGAVTIRRNDFTGLTGSPTFSGITSGNYQCNWWGSSGGPALPGNGGFVPWAGQPIANTAVSCDPTSLPTEVLVCPTPDASPLPRFAALGAGTSNVAVGGTVYLCDGTHTGGVVIQRALTLTSKGPGVATITAPATNQFVVNLTNIAGSFTIHHLRFTGGGTGNLSIGSNVNSVSVHHNEFNPPQTAPYPSNAGGRFGIGMLSNGVGTATIADNQFLGGDVGMQVGSGVSNLAGTTVAITNNTFTGQINTSILAARSTPAAFNIEGNSFSDCGISACIRSNMPARIVGNTMTATLTRQVGDAISIFVQNTSAVQSVITDNTITGVGPITGNRTLSGSYPIMFRAIAVDGAAAAVSRNTITGALQGVLANNVSTLTGSDNAMTTIWAPVALSGGAGQSTVHFTRNDFTDYVIPVSPVVAALTTDPNIVNIRCNWWGVAGGPPLPVQAAAALYTPFATVSIANKPGVVCTP